MNTQRVLLVLLAANLLATLLLYRDVAQLREQVGPSRAVAAPAVDAPPAWDGPRPQPQTGGARPPAVARVDIAASAPQRDTDPDTAPDAAPLAAGAAQENDDLAHIKERFATQYVDAAWTGEVQQALQDAASGSTAYAEITQGPVECRERICMLVLGYTDPAVFDAFIGDLTVALKAQPASSLYFAEPDARGGYATVDVYLVRE